MRDKLGWLVGCVMEVGTWVLFHVMWFVSIAAVVAVIWWACFGGFCE